MQKLKQAILDLKPAKKWTKKSVQKIWAAYGCMLTELFPLARSPDEAINMLLSDSTQIPSCLCCGTTLEFFGLQDSGKYKKFCSISCSASYTASAALATKIENGTNFNFGSENFRNRILELHGVESVGQIESVKNKIRLTMNERYGVHSALQLDKTKLAAHNTQNEARRRQTFVNRYGTASNFGREDTKQMIASTCLKRYGSTNPMKSELIKNRNKDRQLLAWRARRLSNLADVVECLSDEQEIKSQHSVVKWRCVKCNFNFISNIENGKIPRCIKCHPSGKIGSKLESFMLENVLNDIDAAIKVNDRTVISPYEIDYLISDKLGIEVNGLYWHSESVSKSKTKDFKKQLLAEDNGVALMQFYEDEILSKPELIKSIIHARLGVFDKVIMARKCELRFIESLEARKFCEENHLLGSANGSLRAGLYFENQLVACMIIGKSRFNSGNFEIIRFCQLKFMSITGSFGRLLKFLESKLESGTMLETYADRRLFTGGVYLQHGFQFSHASAPGFFVTDYSSRMSRFKFQRHKIGMKLSDYLIKHKLDLIYDCGQLVFTKVIS